MMKYIGDKSWLRSDYSIKERYVVVEEIGDKMLKVLRL